MAGDEESMSGDAHDVSRRDALKKIGIGAGIAWSAPVVLSFYNAAGAATGTPDNSTTTTGETTVPPNHPECVGATCATFTPCSSSNPDCICVSTPDPAIAFCVPGSTPCNIGPVCAPDGSCPPGMFCALDTCCGFNVCTPFTVGAACPPDEQLAPGAGSAQARPRVKTGAGTFGG
jgi:hypothetical protein